MDIDSLIQYGHAVGGTTSVKSLNTVDEVRKFYAKTKRQDEDKDPTEKK